MDSDQYKAEKEAAICRGCRFFSTKPAAIDNTDDDSRSTIDDLVDDIADIAAWEDAGFATDWSEYPFETHQLMRIWRSAEREVREIRDRRMQAVLRSFFKE